MTSDLFIGTGRGGRTRILKPKEGTLRIIWARKGKVRSTQFSSKGERVIKANDLERMTLNSRKGFDASRPRKRTTFLKIEIWCRLGSGESSRKQRGRRLKNAWQGSSIWTHGTSRRAAVARGNSFDSCSKGTAGEKRGFLCKKRGKWRRSDRSFEEELKVIPKRV